MMFPKKFSRITKHKKPRYQLYQPGFNASNSCWLKGEWITLPEEEWRACREQHEELYACVVEESARQHHRNGPTDPEHMTPAQHQAWLSCSGNATIEGRHANGNVGPYGADFAGGRIHKRSIAHMRKIGWKAFRRCRLHPDGEIIDQQNLGLPDDLLLDEDGAPDVTSEIVEQNRQASADMFDACLDPDDGSFGTFKAQMAIQYLLEIEEEIIQAEWDASRGKPDPYTDLGKSRQQYAEMRRKARQSLGGRFDELMAGVKESHNSCARANLDNSDGRLFAFVLPEFHDDGSHDPVGERDVPWNNA